MKSLTVAFITARKEPKFEWFFDSIKGLDFNIIVVDSFAGERNLTSIDATIPIKEGERVDAFITVTKPKPTIWAGPHRITKVDHWAKANASNTAICLCKTDWIAFCDDRCVLSETWLQSVREAMECNYCVAGSYEKRINMRVENGEIVERGSTIGYDHRLQHWPNAAKKCTGAWLFGCTFALPLEWALRVNGFPEDYADGLSFEDVLFGKLIENNGYPIKFDPRMGVVQDRTPGECGPEIKRSDKGVSPNDKSHAVVKIFETAKTSGNSFDIRTVRESVLAGDPFPMPSASRFDWYDGSLIE